MIQYTRAPHPLPQITWVFMEHGDNLYYKYAICQPEDLFDEEKGVRIAKKHPGGMVKLTGENYIDCVAHQIIPRTERDERLIEALYKIRSNK